MLHYLTVFFAIYILGTPQGLSWWWGHLLAAIFALANLHTVAKHYLFWIYIIVASFFACEQRFSLEYVLLAAGFLGCGLNSWWQNLNQKQRGNYLLIVFAVIYFFSHTKLIFAEKGSLILWLPVFLSTVIARSTKRDVAISLYSISGIALIFSNKKTTLLAYLASLAQYLKSKYVYLIGLLIFAASFFLKERIQHFIHKSLISRLFIWSSSLQGWLAKPFLGHGFGTFAIDFPPYRSHASVFGTQTHQQVAHGHGLFTHVLFEQGLLGLAVLIVIFYLVYKKAKQAFLPLLIISLFDAPLVSFSQYLLAALILAPVLINKSESKLKLFSKLQIVTAYIIALTVFIPSVIGHYYYDHQQIYKAIKWDSRNSLYHFMLGADLINRDIVKSEESLKHAVELSPNVSYFYGFLAATKLANNKIPEAQAASKKALEMDGGDAYWYVLSAFSHYQDDPKLFKEHYAKAKELNPDIEILLHNKNYTATEFIGSKKSDARILAFYRTGPKVFLPLPYLE